MGEQAHNLSRVMSKLGPLVHSFCWRRSTSTFRTADLVADLEAAGVQAAPDSPSRVLRELRLQGFVDYLVIDRRKGLYRLLWVMEDPPAALPLRRKVAA